MNPVPGFWQGVQIILSPLAAGIIIYYIQRSAKHRDDKLDSIDSTLGGLADKVGAQNGRINKLETRAGDVEISLARLEERQWQQGKNRNHNSTPRGKS